MAWREDAKITKLRVERLFAGPGLGTEITATAEEINRACDTSGRLVIVDDDIALTVAEHDGKTMVLSAAAGAAATLPAAVGSGAKFTFIVAVTAATGAYVIEVADATDVMDGIIYAADDTATPAPLVWVTAADSDTITMDGSTKGGIIGDRIELIDIGANQWAVNGFIKQSGDEASPFSAEVA